MQMSFSRNPIFIFVPVLLGLVAVARIIYKCNALRKRNRGRKLGSCSKLSYFGVGLSGFIIIALIITACAVKELFIVCAQSAATTLAIAEVSIIFRKTTRARGLTTGRSWALCEC